MTREQLRHVLEHVACDVHGRSEPGQDSTIFDAKELLDIVFRAGFDVGIRDVPDYLAQHAGILVAPAADRFYFLHRSFQEHLAACSLICADPAGRRPPVPIADRFPKGLLDRVVARPDLWENVARLAVDELMAHEARHGDAWRLLTLLCEPSLKRREAAVAALLALAAAEQHGLFEPARDKFDPHVHSFGLLQDTARQVLTDAPGQSRGDGQEGQDGQHLTPEQRDLAGQLLGRRPEMDARPGVGLRPDGLPAIDWVEIPEFDRETGKREFVYQDGTHPGLPSFWIGRFPITYRQFQAFVDAADGWGNPAWWQGLATEEGERSQPNEQRFPFWNHPRENVTWTQAVAFCRWPTQRVTASPDLLPLALRGAAGRRISLPTGWQWEKAARGHDGRRYPWGGNEYEAGRANIDERSGNAGPHYLQKTSAVGMYPHGASPYGVQDLSGNVWEWCLNEYGNPAHFQEDGDARRVVRGGSWNYNHHHAAAGVRSGLDLYDWRDQVGCRVVVWVPSLFPSEL